MNNLYLLANKVTFESWLKYLTSASTSSRTSPTCLVTYQAYRMDQEGLENSPTAPVSNLMVHKPQNYRQRQVTLHQKLWSSGLSLRYWSSSSCSGHAHDSHRISKHNREIKIATTTTTGAASTELHRLPSFDNNNISQFDKDKDWWLSEMIKTSCWPKSVDYKLTSVNLSPLFVWSICV